MDDRGGGNGIETPVDSGTTTILPSVVTQGAVERAPDNGLCRDLTKSLPSDAADHGQAGLCPLCNQIDFFSLTGNKLCRACHMENSPPRPHEPAPVLEVPPPYEDGAHYHVGTLRDVKRRAGSCAGCRLILAAAAYGVDMGGCPTALDQAMIVQKDPFVKCEEDEDNEGWAAGSLALTQLGLNRTIESLLPMTITINHDAPWKRENLVGREVRPVLDMELVKTWLRYCERAHGAACAKQAAAARAHKGGDHRQEGDEDQHHRVRFIDVREYRVVGATTRETYVALSYVWGIRNEPLLLKQTLASYSEPDSLRGVPLPRTIKEAIELTAALGQRYLWVDSLCIVQDDPADKYRQLPIMDLVYSSALIVIVAAAGIDVTAGLPGSSPSHPRTLMPRCVETVHGHEFVVVAPTLAQAIRRSRWNNRGWTYQEAALARRTLVFTDRLVYWSCQVDGWREDLQAGEGSTNSSTPPTPPPRNPVDETNSFSAVLPGACQTKDYCRRVELFSGRRFTNEGDALWAFRGILRMLGTGSVDGYSWALPRGRLDEALLWKIVPCPRKIHERRQPCVVPTDGGFCSLPIPSWSWLSYSGPVKFEVSCEHPVVSRVEWHEPLASEGGVAAMGALPNDVAYGRLRLTANTACLVLRQLQPRKLWRREWLGALARRILGVLAARLGIPKAPSSISLPVNREQADAPWVSASIHLDGGERLGLMDVPRGYFAGGAEKMSEFVLLSEATACADEECRVNESLNLMLVREEDSVAYRVQLAQIGKAQWDKVETRRRTLVLG